jgi:hypothetical protein
MSQDLKFPLQVADYEGHTLTIEISDGNEPHQAPPGCVEVWLRRPDTPDGQPGGHLNNQAIAQFYKNFDGNEDPAKTQAERNALKAEVAELKKARKEDKKELGQFKRRVAELEAQVAKDRALVRNELARAQIATLQRSIVDEADPEN